MKKLILLLGIILLSIPNKPRPFPLKNPGCSCYFNAAVQGIYTFAPLTQFFMLNPNPADYEYIMVKDYCKLINAFSRNNYLQAHIDFFRAVATQMGNMGQQDVDEFFDTFLEQLKKEKKLQEFAQNFLNYNLQFDINCLEPAQFTLAAQQRIQEYINGEVSHNSQVLKVPFNKSLTNSLKDFFTIQQSTNPLLEGCTEKFTLATAPNILFIKVNRFRPDGTKKQDPIDIPLYFDSIPTLQTTNNIQYELIAVMMHMGASGGGHYTAYVKQDTWWYCNDALISGPLNQDQILSGKIKVPNPRGRGFREYSIPPIHKGYVFIYQNRNLLGVPAPLPEPRPAIIKPPARPLPTPPDKTKILAQALKKLTEALNNLQNTLTSIPTE